MRTTQNAKRTMPLILALLMSLPMMAEGIWGAKASFDINAPGKWRAADLSESFYHNGLGFSLGGVYTYYLTDSFFLEPSLSFFYDTYSCDLSMTDGQKSDIDPTIYKSGVRLPLVVGYTFEITDDFAVSVMTGPEFNYAFAGGYRLKDKALKEEIGPLFGNEGGLQRRFSCAWKGGFGFPFGDWRADVEAAIGISDIIVGIPSMKENRFTLSLLRYF